MPGSRPANWKRPATVLMPIRSGRFAVETARCPPDFAREITVAPLMGAPSSSRTVPARGTPLVSPIRISFGRHLSVLMASLRDVA